MSQKAEFAALITRANRDLLGYIMSMVPVRSDAEEVLQRTTVSIWEKFEAFDPDQDFLPWAKRFAFYEVLNFRKEMARERLVFNSSLLESLSNTHEELQPELAARKKALAVCLQRLKESDGVLIRRRYADSQSVVSLASENGQTAKSLYRRLDRIRAQLANCVQLAMTTPKTEP